jgi:DNA-binding response OmpR family regulator
MAAKLKSMPNRITPKHVLVVDDEAVVRRLTYRMLSETGFRVFEAADAEEALLVLSTMRQPIDLVVLDALMPRTNGAMLAYRILEHWPEQHLRFMSANAAQVLAQLGGADHFGYPFLAKLFTGDELLTKVREALRTVPLRFGGSTPVTAQPDATKRPE